MCLRSCGRSQLDGAKQRDAGAASSSVIWSVRICHKPRSYLVFRHVNERSVNEMSSIEPRTLQANEFQVGDVPPGSAALVGDVAVFNVDGNFCATQARCTHRGGLLTPGKLDGSTITCPLHGSQFNVCSGDVLRGPATEPLMTFRVVVDGDVGRISAGSTEA